MKIERIDATPLHTLDVLRVGEARRVERASLPVLHALADGLPPALAGIVAASDLQGMEDVLDGREPRLIGEALAEELEVLGEIGAMPPPADIGVILCGDLFARPELDRRGGSGDVRRIWLAFAERFRWVVGVPGNHDDHGGDDGLAALLAEPKIHFLDGDACVVDGMTVAGIGGVIGNPRRPFRRTVESFVTALRGLLRQAPAMVLMHDGPDEPQAALAGHAAIRGELDRARPTFVIRGHCYWDTPLVTLAGGTQVLNTDGRVVLMTPAH
jgi:hypothetical protein